MPQCTLVICLANIIKATRKYNQPVMLFNSSPLLDKYLVITLNPYLFSLGWSTTKVNRLIYGNQSDNFILCSIRQYQNPTKGQKNVALDEKSGEDCLSKLVDWPAHIHTIPIYDVPYPLEYQKGRSMWNDNFFRFCLMYFSTNNISILLISVIACKVWTLERGQYRHQMSPSILGRK